MSRGGFRGGQGGGGGSGRGGDGGGGGRIAEPITGETSATRFVGELHKQAFREIFPTPIDNHTAVFKNIEYPPEVQSILIFEIPTNFGNNATSFGSIVRAPRELQPYRDLLLMLSLCVSNPTIGTPQGVDAAPQDAGAGPGGRQPVAGGARRADQQANHVINGKDARGTIDGDGHDLKFTYRGQLLDRVDIFLEDVHAESNDAVIKYRFWFFVYDKSFNFGEALEQVIEQNRFLYGPGATAPVVADSFVPHYNTHTVAQFVERMVVPYLYNGIHAGMHADVRNEISSLIETLKDHHTVANSAIPLRNPEHIVHPTKIFNKYMAFACDDRNVCLDQRTPGNYFNIIGVEEAMGAHATDADLIRLEDQGVEMDEDELADLERIGEQRLRDYDDEGAAAGEEHSSAGCLLDKHVLEGLRRTPDRNFVHFALPERVFGVSYAKGRRLMRMPLPEVMRTMSTSAGFPAQSIVEIYTDVTAQDTDTRINEMSVEQRREELEQIMAEVEPRNRLPITNQMLQTTKAYRSALKEFRMAQVNEREERSRAHARREVIDWMEATAEGTYESTDPTSLMKGKVHSNLLPENMTSIDTHTLKAFASMYELIKHRQMNFLELARLEARHDASADPKGYQEALMSFRKRTMNDMFDALMTSTTLPASDTSMRDWFTKQPPSEQWGDHPMVVKNLSSYANFKLKRASLYNHTFRGNTGQKVFMLSDLVYHNGFYYKWGLRLNLMQVGPPSVGKSHVYECIEVLAVPGSFEVYGHVTDKSGLGNEIHVNKTECNHEAPLSLVGVDRFGREILADPVKKDQLTRSRTITSRFATDKDGTVVTRVYNSMRMINSMIATNEIVPPEESPIMTRYIIMTVSSMKRPDFNAADSNMPLADLLTSKDDMLQVHQSQLFSYYVYLVCKAIMVGSIPDVSMDAANIIIKEVLTEFTRRTRIPTSQTRKREMLSDSIKTATIQYAVHTALFSPLAMKHSHEIDPETKKLVFKPFTPQLVVTEVMKYLWATDEITADILTLFSFMWEYEHRFTILDAIACCRNRISPHHKPRFMRPNGPQFRVIANPNFVPVAGAFGRKGGAGYPQTNFPNRGQKTPNFGALTRGGQATKTTSDGPADFFDEEEEDRGDVDTRSQFLEDYRYVSIQAPQLTDIYSIVAAMIKKDTPSGNEVQRTLRDLSKVTYDAHVATLEVVVSVDAADDGKEMEVPAEEDDPIDHGLESVEEEEEESLASTSEDPLLTRFGRKVQKHEKHARLMKERAEAIKRRDVARNLRGYEKTRALLRQNIPLEWKLDSTSITSPERVVIIERHPQQPQHWQVSVLIEHLKDDSHKDAMVKSIQEVLSSDMMPKEGKTFITSLPYIHNRGKGNAETMPQFFQTLKIAHNPNKRLTHFFTNIGTPDSEAYSRSYMRSQHMATRANDYGASEMLSDKMGIEFGPEMSINEFACLRHWTRCGYSPTDENWRNCLPEVVSAASHTITDKLIKNGNANISTIERYPHDSVERYLARRSVRPDTLPASLRPEFIHNAADVAARLMGGGGGGGGGGGTGLAPVAPKAVAKTSVADQSRAILKQMSGHIYAISDPNSGQSGRSRLEKKNALLDRLKTVPPIPPLSPTAETTRENSSEPSSVEGHKRHRTPALLQSPASPLETSATAAPSATLTLVEKLDLARKQNAHASPTKKLTSLEEPGAGVKRAASLSIAELAAMHPSKRPRTEQD